MHKVSRFALFVWSLHALLVAFILLVYGAATRVYAYIFFPCSKGHTLQFLQQLLLLVGVAVIVSFPILRQNLIPPPAATRWSKLCTLPMPQKHTHLQTN